MPESPQAALQRLIQGNQRFVAKGAYASTTVHFENLTSGQDPFAVILGCSDSRAPVEIVFDQGLGDLFVIRVAGNVVAPSQIGSVEFALEAFDTKLVVVMGHSRCGAIRATVNALTSGQGAPTRGLQAIVDRVRPAVEGVVYTGRGLDDAEIYKAAVRSNVRVAASALRHGSAMIEERIERGELIVVGAEYCLETGVVDFFEGGGLLGG